VLDKWTQTSHTKVFTANTWLLSVQNGAMKKSDWKVEAIPTTGSEILFRFQFFSVVFPFILSFINFIIEKCCRVISPSKGNRPIQYCFFCDKKRIAYHLMGTRMLYGQGLPISQNLNQNLKLQLAVVPFEEN
jgi:hypothetical protein